VLGGLWDNTSCCGCDDVTCCPFRGGLALQLDVHIRRLDHQMKCLETAMKARGEVAVCCVECQVWRLCDVCYVIGDPPAQAFRLTCYQQRRRMPACRRDPLASATESSECCPVPPPSLKAAEGVGRVCGLQRIGCDDRARH
jgi:hypothetical protein